MKFCPKCSSEFENKFKFCREDGTILQTKVLGNTCPKCGNETEEGQKFCRNCGERLNPRGEPPQPTVEPPKIQTAGTQERENLEPAEPIAEPAEIVSAPIEQKVVQQPENAALGAEKQTALTEVAETCISEGNLQAAITALEPVISNDPRNREVYLLHLLASVKLYSVYGYEKEIESLSGLSGLSEKEKDLAREIFLCRFEEARKRGDEKTASDYQRLAARVVLAQPHQGAASEAKDV